MSKLSKNNTTVTVEDGRTTITLHRTPVVRFDGREITLNSGGWQTATTKTRMNQAANVYGLDFSVSQADGQWWVNAPGACLPFRDGMVIGRR